MRGITAFLPRIQQEETNPTFEHPEDWDRLSLREKANLIIFDNIVKLMELQYCGSVVGHQEGEAQNTSSPGLLGSGANPLGKGLNTDVGPTGDLQDHIILNSEPSYLCRALQDGGNIKNNRSGFPDKKPSILGREPNTAVGIPLI